MALKIIGVYLIRNMENNKEYVGASNNVLRRLKEHESFLRKNKHYNTHLQSAYNKRPDSFIFELYRQFNTVEEAFKFEEEYATINSLWTVGYNLYKPGTTSKQGSISKSLTGRKLSEEHKQALRGERPMTQGKNHFNVRKIYIKNISNNYYFEWDEGANSLSKFLNIKSSAIRNNLCGLSNSCKGYIFSYENLNAKPA